MSDVPLIAFAVLAGYLLISAVIGYVASTNLFKLALILIVLLATANGLLLIAECDDDCSSAAGAGSVIIMFFGCVPTLLACAVGRLLRRRVRRSRTTPNATETT